jgi:uncharacterized membrane protein YbhN (UPF0104 family)
MATTATVDDLSPPGEPVGRKRPAWLRWLIWAAVIAVIAAIASLCGLNIRGWLHNVWHTLTGISAKYIVADIALMVVKTTATAYAWYSILHFAYPRATRWRDVLAAYAVSVALNNILPANLGTFVMLVLFSILIAEATFASILGAYGVEKIFFTISGAFTYLYLFITIGGSFNHEFKFIKDHRGATLVLIGGGVFLLYLLGRRLWPRVVAWWDQAKAGGAILGKPSAYFGRVFLPSFIGWLAMLGTIAVMLAAYSIPVTFNTVMNVAGGNSLANVTAVTPGGAGVNQAFNVASLKGVASSADAAAYSVASQLISTAWNIVFAILVVIWAWGWTEGKTLVRQSYDEAKRREEEERAKRKAKKEAASAAKEAAG